jgi:hypothetical protein
MVQCKQAAGVSPKAKLLRLYFFEKKAQVFTTVFATLLRAVLELFTNNITKNTNNVNAEIIRGKTYCLNNNKENTPPFIATVVPRITSPAITVAVIERRTVL